LNLVVNQLCKALFVLSSAAGLHDSQ